MYVPLLQMKLLLLTMENFHSQTHLQSEVLWTCILPCLFVHAIHSRSACRLQNHYASYLQMHSVLHMEKLATKYETTFEGVEAQIHDTEAQLSGMIEQLTGSEYDMEGLAELRKMLGGL